MLLTELEGFLRSSQRSEEPQIPDQSNLDIDHIMPRSWYEHWPLPNGVKATAGDAQTVINSELIGVPLSDHLSAVSRRMQAIPTLGNLPLLNLSVNREAQNKAFPTTNDLLIKNKNLRLNVRLVREAYWDGEASSEERSVGPEGVDKCGARGWRI